MKWRLYRWFMPCALVDWIRHKSTHKTTLKEEPEYDWRPLSRSIGNGRYVDGYGQPIESKPHSESK